MTDKTYLEARYWGKKTIRGGAQSVYKQLLPDGETTELSPTASLKLRDHSPDGFQWGYTGSGPSQLALAILLDVTGNPELSLDHYYDFKLDMVAFWGEEWSITTCQVLEWLGKLRSRELQKKAILSSN